MKLYTYNYDSCIEHVEKIEAENTRLKELNREMVETLRTLYRDTHLRKRLKEYEVRALISPFLDKREEV